MRDWFFDWIVGLNQAVTLGEKEGVCAKAKFQHKLICGTLLPFLETHSLHNGLISLVKRNWKNSETALKTYILTLFIDNFLSFKEKQILFVLCG